MSGGLRLTITTPMEVLVDAAGVSALRASDESGSFGILPRHADFLTTLDASVVRWRGEAGDVHYCALRAGVLTVSDGQHVAIACREGVLGDDLAALEDRVADLRRKEREAGRTARVEEARLQAGAVRQIMRYLNAGKGGSFEHPVAIPSNGDGGVGP